MDYRIENYGKKGVFSSFLPGIAGIKGVPVWCYYVNRGQGVVSFGVDNKDHAIMEFYPAHMAYQNVKRTGFRTFIRKNGEFIEPFMDEDIAHEMNIGMNALNVMEDNAEAGIRTDVHYYVLPEERVGALVRKVTIENTGDVAEFEVLDGMPNVIPYGVGQDSMKNMTQTAKAWMQVEDHEQGLPFFRVRVSMDDSAKVSGIKGGNFATGYDEQGNRLRVVCDPDVIFGYDMSLGRPRVFEDLGLESVLSIKENISNLLPVCFFVQKKVLKKGESLTFYEMIGQVEDKDILPEFIEKINGKDFFEDKSNRAAAIVNELTEVVATKTGNKEFDEYTRYTYMDNVLRGGVPIKLPGNKIFYVYSRKHGDLERDYNYFSMLPEYYSQGNGNFRDVNQNRRCDTFFSSFVGTENIKTFYSLIQLDGYNPLAIEKITYSHKEVDHPFTPGSLYALLLERMEASKAEKEFERIMEEAEGGVAASFGEGYWSDHWTYNLDLVEEYLGLYPDKKSELLSKKDYTYFLSQANINPRIKRYAKTENGIRQYYYLDETKKRDTKEKLVKINNKPYKGSLLEKLVLLSTIKFATLDPYGMGVEMEGGKPGWYDALNGLPGMLGSSMAETFELKRMVEFVLASMESVDEEIEFFEELHDLFKSVVEATLANADSLKRYQVVNDIKEEYRARVFEGITGKTLKISKAELNDGLQIINRAIAEGIDRAKTINGNITPTYFAFDVTEFEVTEDGILPLNFEVVKLPNFLEGSVRYLKLDLDQAEKQNVYKNVKGGDLFDKKLSMYKVNAALETASYEIGRCRAFTPGWLENESIWLHMEYKYLLEVLKSGLYEEFAEDAKNAMIPFLDEDVYGRSILENSSFIVSSNNPNEKLHGKGFVARLSGSTIEFISMWKLMMFGDKPFELKEQSLEFKLNPFVPEYLVPEDGILSTKFMGFIDVEYQLDEKKNYIPGNYCVDKYVITKMDGSVEEVPGEVITGDLAYSIRENKVSKITVHIQ